MSKAFQVYVGVMLMVITLLLAALVGGLIYAGRDVRSQVNHINSKISNFNSSLNQLNGDLNNINGQLKTNNSDITGLK